jgi:hypothetical protein
MPTVGTTFRGKQRQATNSAAYDAALGQPGSLTVWFTDAAVAAWQAEARTRGVAARLAPTRGQSAQFWAGGLCTGPAPTRTIIWSKIIGA